MLYLKTKTDSIAFDCPALRRYFFFLSTPTIQSSLPNLAKIWQQLSKEIGLTKKTRGSRVSGESVGLKRRRRPHHACLVSNAIVLTRSQAAICARGLAEKKILNMFLAGLRDLHMFLWFNSISPVEKRIFAINRSCRGKSRIQRLQLKNCRAGGGRTPEPYSR